MTTISRRKRASTILFCCVFSLLVAHELDAVTAEEWRLLPVLGRLREPLAETAFVLLHIPLVAALSWFGFCAEPKVAVRVRKGICAFVVLHALAHAALSDHPLYAFEPPVETITVYGAAVMAAVFLFFARTRGAS